MSRVNYYHSAFNLQKEKTMYIGRNAQNLKSCLDQYQSAIPIGAPVGANKETTTKGLEKAHCPTQAAMDSIHTIHGTGLNQADLNEMSYKLIYLPDEQRIWNPFEYCWALYKLTMTQFPDLFNYLSIEIVEGILRTASRLRNEL